MAHGKGAADESRDQLRAGAGAMAAVVAISTAAIAIRLAGALPPVWIAGVRLAITGFVLLPFCLREWPELIGTLRSDRSVLARTLVAAACLALHFATWMASLTLTSVVTSVALVATQPLFAAGLGRMLGDRVPWNAYLGALIAIVGGYVMSGAEVGAPVGAGLALAGAFFAAAYLAVGRAFRARLPLAAYFVLVNLLASAMLLIWGVLTTPVSADAWSEALAYVVYLGLVPGIVGHGLLNYAVRHIELHVVSLLVLLEPIGAGLLAWWWLSEAPVLAEILGGGLILMGVGVGAKRSRDTSQ